ncbi:hypothetical protein E3N88_20290 [Mikania micrantha]|uniref:Uncharacterized protein n=1 Tax=Mikania micrantha TaxID=192012 RepID=A0A5N6NJ11_9ASTR|nr:hypothetical protein E3N88_20290 [Mikania micrantha]
MEKMKDNRGKKKTASTCDVEALKSNELMKSPLASLLLDFSPAATVMGFCCDGVSVGEGGVDGDGSGRGGGNGRQEKGRKK